MQLETFELETGAPLKKEDFAPYVTQILRKRYLRKNKEGKVKETPEEMFKRVSKAIALADLIYDEKANTEKTENEFYTVMKNLEFLPNSPTLMNAGTSVGQLAACFVLPIRDSVYGIFESLKNAALIHKSGAGTGFSFSNLRPKGNIIKSTQGVSSGPMSFLEIFDKATEVMQSGGRRRGANMGVMRVDHPDIYDFIRAKFNEDSLKNFNLSVSMTDEFMNALIRDEQYGLRDPCTSKILLKTQASNVFDIIARMAWQNGEPGIIFIDRINAANPTPAVGLIETTNPCGEQPLLPYESCILGSINLAKVVKEGKVDWKRLGEIVKIGVHFLDNAIDVNKYPLKKIEKVTKRNRKIGLGVMGFADLLIKLQIPYNSGQGIAIAEKIMRFISMAAKKESVELAITRGSFPNFEKSFYPSRGYTRLRNATLTTIAPTGSISLIAGCSSGIEPIYAIAICRKILGRIEHVGLHPLFREVAVRNSLNMKRIIEQVSRHGSIKDLPIVPAETRRIFVTALDISPEYHVRMQAAFQKYTDNAVSKTVNMPISAKVSDVRNVFLLAYKLGCKGVTVYRNRSRNEQVLYYAAPIQIEKGNIETECLNGTCQS